MILVGAHKLKPMAQGKCVRIDADRRIEIYRQDGKCFIRIYNGTKETRVLLSRDAAEAMLDCLGATLESWDELSEP